MCAHTIIRYVNTCVQSGVTVFRCLCDDGAVKMCAVGGECGPGVCGDCDC